MSSTTCKVWGCSRPLHNLKYSSYCKRHKELAHYNGHPTFTPPALNRKYACYDQDLALGFNAGKRWYKEADLSNYEKAFETLLDDAENLKELSQHRRLGDLPIKQQLLYLLKQSVERKGRQETMRRWVCMYLSAINKEKLFPNRKTLAVFVCRKSFIRRSRMPEHKTHKGNFKGYRLNANRALKMLEVLEPILNLAFISANNMALWYRYYYNHLNLAKARQEYYDAKRNANEPLGHIGAYARLRTLESITNKYLNPTT